MNGYGVLKWWQRKTEVSTRDLFHFHFTLLKSNIDCPVIEPGPQQVVTKPLSHCTAVNIHITLFVCAVGSSCVDICTPVTPGRCRSQWPRGLRRRSAGHSPTVIVGSNPNRGMNVCLLWVLCVCKVEDSLSGWSPVQRSPTDCGASLCDLETSWMRRLWPTGGCYTK